MDTLHAYGITMSQKTSYRGVDTLAAKSREALQESFKVSPIVITHDNINIAFRTHEERLDKKSHFDSGTAATAFVVPDPSAWYPNNRQQQELIKKTIDTPLTAREIFELELRAAPRLHEDALHFVLAFLKDAPQFHYSTWNHCGDPVFAQPPPVFPLPTGAEHATPQYMFNTMHIEEASVQGNEEVIQEIMKQLGITSAEQQRKFAQENVLVWVGDQLTVVRIRSIKKNHCEDLNSFERLENIQEAFGWFHLQLCFEHNLHNQYYGTQSTPGSIAQAATTLHRKGLGTKSIQGLFHHNIREMLLHMAAARFRNLWCVVGGVAKLHELRDKTPPELHRIATRIVDEFASSKALKAQRKHPDDEHDEVLYQAVQWNRDILDYIILDDAIRSGDVGRLELLLPRLLFRFSGGKNYKYATEILETLYGLVHSWTPEVK